VKRQYNVIGLLLAENPSVPTLITRAVVRKVAGWRMPMRSDIEHVKVLPLSLTLCVVAIVFVAVTAQGAKLGFSKQEQETQGIGQDTEQSEIAVPLPKGKKLILTDGSFHIVREYHREGDRVRYYSLERSAWEEIPAALINWEATQKTEAEQAAQEKELDNKIAETKKAARFAGMDVDRSFEVRPGIFLPDDVGFYAVDANRIASLQQEKAEMHTEKSREAAKVITGVPLISSKQDMDILGKQSKLRIHKGDAEFYFRTADQRDPHLTLLRA
jgi:hypothetical protein